jgi:hypothetical protein
MFTDIPLFKLSDHIQTRWASAENWRGEKGAACKGENLDPIILAANLQKGGSNDITDGRKRSAQFLLPPGSSKTLAEVQGASGMIRRIWLTLGNRSPEWLRGLRLDIYWDGAATPAVSAPLGDFFGHGLGRMVTFENALFSSPEGRSFVSIAPMPFRTGMKVVITNELSKNAAGPVNLLQSHIQSQCYFDVDYTLGDRHEADIAYFHAHWRRERPTTMGRDFEFLPRVTGRGRFLGVNVGVIPDTATYPASWWWGEGEVKFYLDGDTTHPTLCGTGSEDYIGTAWGQGKFANLYQGCPLADRESWRYSFYRLHIPDPVYFHSDLRVTMQQLGGCGPNESLEMLKSGQQLMYSGQPIDYRQRIKNFLDDVPFGGYSLIDRQDDWSSCAYFYLDRPENGLPALAPVAERIAGL